MTLLDAFEGRRMLIAYCFMRNAGRPAPEQCEGCSFYTSQRGVEAMDNSYRLLDLTVYGRQESWEDSPAGWPQRPEGQHPYRNGERPIVQWPRLKAGYSGDLGTERGG